MTTYAYLRVSTNEQARSGLGLDAQRAKIESAATYHGWRDVAWHVDEGISAKNMERPALRTILGRIERGDRLVVSKLDRLSRSVYDFATLMHDAHREGWSVVILELDLDTSTPTGAFVANILASVAELERAMIGERTSAALQAAKANGTRLGVGRRTLPAATLERIVGLRDGGLSFGGIAKRLVDDGVPTATGGQWHPSTVRAALRSWQLDQEALQARSAAV